MKEKIQKQNKLLNHIIEQFDFKPTRDCKGLFVSKKIGAVLYWHGGVLEIDFGIDEQAMARDEVSGNTRKVNYTSILGRLRNRLQFYLRLYEHFCDCHHIVS